MAEKIFYDFPVRLSEMGRKGSFERCDLANSVRKNLRLMLFSPPLRVRMDPIFGCFIHRMQFLAVNRAMNNRQENEFKVALERNIELLIKRFEPRIIRAEVEAGISYNLDEQLVWKNGKYVSANRNAIQVTVSIKGEINPDLAFGQTLELEDTIPLF